MTVDLLFVAHNRLAFTKASFAALIEHTDLSLVDKFIVLDDASTDGTAEFLADEIHSVYKSASFGGPVAMMNRALDIGRATFLAKIDNDVIVCPGWLETMLGVLAAAPELDALGMEPGFASPFSVLGSRLDDRHGYEPASHIGGVGVFRRRVFAHRPRGHERFFGLTEHWRQHARCGWVDPDLPVFLLDHLPFEPWLSLAVGYCDRGWSRPWPKYDPGMAAYWEWAFAETVA